MRTYLFGSIELFSNHKSFSLWVDTKSNLWLLLHFKDLEIKSKTLIYQDNNGYKQRKNTLRPQRKMQKKHKNTAELLDYLNTKFYDICQLEIEFTNGWKIKQRPYIEFWFYTNATSERDNLIHKLLGISGQGPLDLLSLVENITYSFRGADVFEKMFENEMPSPDEFWSEARLEKWKEAYIKKHYSKKVQDDNKDNSEENVFVSTLNISKEFTGTKLEGWTEGDPF